MVGAVALPHEQVTHVVECGGYAVDRFARAAALGVVGVGNGLAVANHAHQLAGMVPGEGVALVVQGVADGVIVDGGAVPGGELVGPGGVARPQQVFSRWRRAFCCSQNELFRLGRFFEVLKTVLLLFCFCFAVKREQESVA